MPRLDGGSGRGDQIPGYRSVCQRLFRREAPFVCLCEDDKAHPTLHDQTGCCEVVLSRKESIGMDSVVFGPLRAECDRGGRWYHRGGAAPRPAEHGLEPGRYIIFTAGRIVPRKGCHFVLEALRQMATDDKLLIVGDMSHVPEYTQQLLALADERVRFAGFISSKGLLFGLIALSRLFVFPTTYEAMAITLLEVAALRTPLVASDIPENREVLPEQALFFRSGDVANLRTQMEWALAHPTEMNTLAGRAYQWVAENYRWPGIIATYEQLYDTLLAGPVSATPVEQPK